MVGRTLAAEDLRLRLAREFEPLIVSYLALAKGSYALFARQGQEWIRVTDAETMERCLQSGASFYRIEQQRPDNRTLIDAFDRLFGKPGLSIDMTAHLSAERPTVIHQHLPALPEHVEGEVVEP